MNLLIDTLLWINLATLCFYAALTSYFDVKTREFDPLLWIPGLIVMLPIAGYMYLTGYWYSWENLAISVVMCGIFYVTWKKQLIEGADYLYLCIISLFWILTPFNGVHGPMQPLFYIYLMFSGAITAIAVLVFNLYEGKRGSVIEMMSQRPGGVPFMVTIAVAFLASVIFG